MLLYHWSDSGSDIYFKSEKSKQTWSIKNAVEDLGPEFTKTLLVIHALTGCDTTSAIYGKGKPTILKQFKGNIFNKNLIIFQISSIKNQIIESWVRLGLK